MSAALLYWAKWAAISEPISVSILGNPINDGFLFLGSDTLVRRADTLEDIVDILGDSEDSRKRLGNYIGYKQSRDEVCGDMLAAEQLCLPYQAR